MVDWFSFGSQCCLVSYSRQLSANVQYSRSCCMGASGVLQITGSNTVIFAVLEACLMSPLHCVLN